MARGCKQKKVVVIIKKKSKTALLVPILDALGEGFVNFQ
jgi:hypothetical protein